MGSFTVARSSSFLIDKSLGIGGDSLTHDVSEYMDFHGGVHFFYFYLNIRWSVIKKKQKVLMKSHIFSDKYHSASVILGEQKSSVGKILEK